MEARKGYGCELYAGGAEVSFEIANLNDVSELKFTIADRIWNAWWRPHGKAFQIVMDFMNDLPQAPSIPFALVAHAQGTYLGSVLVVASDLDDRPELSPWVAALWVDPEHRSKGIGAALVKAAASEIFKLGHEAAFLCATSEKRPMYLRQGWGLLEQGVGTSNLDVFELTRAA
jgi:predicted N-acetyltransferase YhbS